MQQVLAADEGYKTLRWFSDDYLAVFPEDTAVFLADLRFGGMQDTIQSHHDLIFKFTIKEENGQRIYSESRERPTENIGEMFRLFIKRIKGY